MQRYSVPAMSGLGTMVMNEFKLRINERTYHIGVESKQPRDGQMLVEGFSLNWAITEIEGNLFRVNIDGIEYEVELREGEAGQLLAVVEGAEYPFEAIGLVRGRPTPPKREERAAAAVPEAVEGALTAMMPSKVIAVHVKEGDKVQAGQVVLVLEAMKMESELSAPYDGVVVGVHCVPGDSVDPGMPLAVIEPEEDA